jgi:tRNA1(Val) A37 N6-methylase TrmN6
MERIEELGIDNLKIIQDSSLFCFGTDSVCLSDFVVAKKGDNVVDLCSGNGIIPLLLSAKTSAKKIYGIEILKKSYDLFKKSIELNSLSEKIEAINDDIKNASSYFKRESVSVVTCNPPYMSNAGFVNPNDELAIARHEILTNLKEIVDVGSYLLKYGGSFYMVHRSERICDILCFLREKSLEPKVIKFIAPNSEKAPKLVLVKAIKGAKEGVKIEPNLYVNI